MNDDGGFTIDSPSIATIVKFRSSVSDLIQSANCVPSLAETIQTTNTLHASAKDDLTHIVELKESLNSKCHELRGLIHTVRDDVRKLEVIDATLKLLDDAESCAELVAEIENHYTAKEFYQLVVKVERLRDLYETTVHPHSLELGIVSTSLESSTEKWQRISADWLHACLNQCVSVKISASTLQLNVNNANVEQLFKHAGQGSVRKILTLLAEQMLETVCIPILRCTSCTAKLSANTVNLEMRDETTPSEDPSVLPVLCDLLRFLKQTIFKYCKDASYIQHFGSALVPELSSRICSMYLRPNLPKIPSILLSGHCEVIFQQISKVQEFLIENKFQAEPNKLLLDFSTSYVNVSSDYFQNSLMVQGRDALLSDTTLDGDLITVGGDVESGAKGDVSAVAGMPKVLVKALRAFLDGEDNPFAIPRCKITCSLAKFTAVIDSVYEESCRVAELANSDPNNRTNVLICLAKTARYIGDIYLAVLPTLIRNRKQSVAKGSATSLRLASVVLSNCTYLASYFTIAELKFSRLLHLPSISSTTTCCIFADLIQPLRHAGWLSYKEAIEQSQKQLIDSELAPALAKSFGQLASTPSARTQGEEALSKAAKAVSRMASVGRDVLPDKAWSSGISILLDAVFGTVVSKTTALTDIPATESRALFEVLSRFCDDMEGISSEALSPRIGPKSVGKVRLSALCPSTWTRLQEMLQLLNSNLQEILERWADSAGPLAASFEADEIRSLIRALFQNSDVRQAALARIR